jgi:hypothetical protein
MRCALLSPVKGKGGQGPVSRGSSRGSKDRGWRVCFVLSTFNAVELSSCFKTNGEERVVEGDPKLKGIPVVASE